MVQGGGGATGTAETTGNTNMEWTIQVVQTIPMTSALLTFPAVPVVPVVPALPAFPALPVALALPAFLVPRHVHLLHWM